MDLSLDEKFTSATGSPWLLTEEDGDRLTAYLRQNNYLMEGERVVFHGLAGEGNMNLTLRILTDRRRLILKQSRPWVAKFPDIAAPVERIVVEWTFLRAVSQDPYLSLHVPELLKTDADNFVMLMEDLGSGGGDLTKVYRKPAILRKDDLSTLLKFLGRLHRLEVADFPDNMALRKVNHAHVFDLPFRSDNGFPLAAIHPGLDKVAAPFHHDEKLHERVRELGDIYLSDGPSLLHGDFYPGSFMRVEDQLFVIDGEFAFRGRPEFDVGVLLAHMMLARASEAQLKQIDKEYDKPAGFDVSLARAFCYVEIIRRLIGIAQLPVELELDERRALLEQARAGLL